MSLIQQGGSHRYMAINIHKVALFQKRPELCRIANDSDLVTADGLPVVWVSRLMGRPLKARVTGMDLMEKLIPLASERGYRVYFLGAKPDALARLMKRYKKEYPSLQIAGSADGYWSARQEPEVVRKIHDARPDLLFLGISSPRKELFLDRHIQELEVPFSMGVGGAFDVIAGVTRRAPGWMQDAGLEWFWRIMQEPVRMSKRYLVDGIRFALATIQELLAARQKKDLAVPQGFEPQLIEAKEDILDSSQHPRR